MDPITRRQFLQGLGVSGLAAAAGSVLPIGPSLLGSDPAGAAAARRLVIITLYGGNDGLNTVIPYTDNRYRALRGALALGEAQGVHPIANGIALHPSLKQLAAVWARNDLAIVRGVGYPNIDLSHFHSMDIWQSAQVDRGLGTGWIGRWLDTQPHDPYRAISVGQFLPLAMRGASETALTTPAWSLNIGGSPTFKTAFAQLGTPSPSDPAPWGTRITRTNGDLAAAADTITRVLATPTPSALNRVPTDLAKNLAVIAKCIREGLSTRVFATSIDGFDSHANQLAMQGNSLKVLDDAVGAFLTDLQSIPGGNNVVVLIYSEFGRRAAANASGGTDHGAASDLLLAGAPVRGGFYGAPSPLDRLDNLGNLAVTTDFRRVYSTLLARVLRTDPVPILGAKYRALPFV